MEIYLDNNEVPSFKRTDSSEKMKNLNESAPLSFQNEKITKIASKKTEVSEEIEWQQSQLRQRFEHNFNAIMSLKKPGDFKNFVVKDGQLINIEQKSSSVKQEVVELIQQTYIQQWGKLIDANKGYAILPNELQRMDSFRRHLLNACPEGIPKGDSSKPLSILSRSFIKRSEPTEEEIKIPQLKKEVVAEQLKQVKDLASIESKKRISQLYSDHLQFVPLQQKGEKGVTETEWIIMGDKEKIAIRKGLDIDWVKFFLEKQHKIEKEKLHFIGAFNESLASNIDVLMNGRLGVPLAMITEKGEKGATQHAYVENIGNYNSIQEKNINLEQLPIESSQHFVFSQLILKNSDCHGGNILFTPSYDPIPIDFGRILNPASSIKAAYLKFPCLEKKINEEDKKFYSELDVEKTVQTLSEHLKIQYPTEFNDTESFKMISMEFEQLKARLYMVKDGIKMGLNQRQLIALDLPPLAVKESVFVKSISIDIEKLRNLDGKEWSSGHIEVLGQVLANYFSEKECAIIMDQKNYREIRRDLFRDLLAQRIEYIKENMNNKGFNAAWKKSFSSKNSKLNIPKFRKNIYKEMNAIKKIPLHEIYRENIEKKAYEITGRDVSWDRI